jgi:hypothetical protein
MKTPDKIKDLVGAATDICPDARLKFQSLPSGVSFSRVGIGRRHFVLEYHPVEGTGVSENFDDTPPFVGHDAVFKSLDQAIEHFKSLLASAARTEADHLPQPFVLNDKKS